MVSASFENLENWSLQSNPVKARKFYEVKKEQAGTVGDRLFEETLAEFEAIQAEYDSIRSLLIKGINPRTRDFEDVYIVNLAFDKFKIFISKYWQYFTSEDKKRLQETAQKLIQGFDRPLSTITLDRVRRGFRLFFKYRKEIFKKEDNPFIQHVEKSKAIAETILKLAQEDRQQLSQAQNEEALNYLDTQGELFDKKLPELLPKYKGMYVFFENGEVKDADYDEEALIERVLPKVGYRAIFVDKVTEPII
ncbi:MAG: hypothetical protein MUD14_04785 [Hydrococcus sp. Prado102]|jgi:hypothetical protein|nr:hypothetical protein [Hydrococcus sp. Prado102]